jgi:hypothetical protein
MHDQFSSVVLSQLVITLGTFVECLGPVGGGSEVGLLICSSLLQFIAGTLRYHGNPAVRQAALFATRAVVLDALPSFVLFQQFSALQDVTMWLQGKSFFLVQ